MVSRCTFDLISWKILLKTCCLKCLIGHDTIRWRAELSDTRRIRPYLNTAPVARLLTNIGLYDTTENEVVLCCFSNLFENLLNAQCIHDISHLLGFFDENTKYEKI